MQINLENNQIFSPDYYCNQDNGALHKVGSFNVFSMLTLSHGHDKMVTGFHIASKMMDRVSLLFRTYSRLTAGLISARVQTLTRLPMIRLFLSSRKASIAIQFIYFSWSNKK